MSVTARQILKDTIGGLHAGNPVGRPPGAQTLAGLRAKAGIVEELGLKPDTQPPDILESGEARAEWCRMRDQLHVIGVLDQLDPQLLLSYALNWLRWLEAERDRDANGDYSYGIRGQRVVSPAFKVSMATQATMLGFMNACGLTPATRLRARPTPGNDLTDNFGDFLKKRSAS